MKNDTSKQSLTKKTLGYKTEINEFIKHIEAQSEIFPLIISLLSIKLRQELKEVDEFVKENGIAELKNAQENEIEFLVPYDKLRGFLRLAEGIDTSALAFKTLPTNFVVSLVSQYDAYLGGLIRIIFESKPELLNSSEKNLAFSELIKFSSIDEARKSIVEKEVESVLRESHLKQFKWLESKLSMKLREDLPSFSDFIEITERRNLFVHCNGVVSRQYLLICAENNVNGISEVNVGEKLTVSGDYFSKCCTVLFEIGVKLGQVIWRKLHPKDVEDADKHLNEVCYQLLVKGQYDLAINLLTFATDTIKKHHDQAMFCMFTINKALAYYLSNNPEESRRVLSKVDWSATNDKFNLSLAVLKEDYPESIRLMKTIGAKHKEVTPTAYREWPLFSRLRKTDEFKSAYREIFGEELIYKELKPKSIEDIANEIIRLSQEPDEEE